MFSQSHWQNFIDVASDVTRRQSLTTNSLIPWVLQFCCPLFYNVTWTWSAGDFSLCQEYLGKKRSHCLTQSHLCHRQQWECWKKYCNSNPLWRDDSGWTRSWQKVPHSYIFNTVNTFFLWLPDMWHLEFVLGHYTKANSNLDLWVRGSVLSLRMLLLVQTVSLSAE